MNAILEKLIMKHFHFFAPQCWLVLAHTFRGGREGQEDWPNSRLAEIGPKTWLVAKIYQKKRQTLPSPAVADPQTVGAEVCFCLRSVAELQCCSVGFAGPVPGVRGYKSLTGCRGNAYPKKTLVSWLDLVGVCIWLLIHCQELVSPWHKPGLRTRTV